MKFNIVVTLAALMAVFQSCRNEEPEFWLGADISWATEYEAKGYRFYNSQYRLGAFTEDGRPTVIMDAFKDWSE